MRRSWATGAVRAAVAALACASALAGCAGSSARTGTAIRPQGIAALNTAPWYFNGWVPSISCSSAGNCAAVGGYVDRYGYLGALVVDERGGVWGRAQPVPGLATGPKSGDQPEGTEGEATGSFVTGVSCTAADYCALALTGPLVDGARGGTWGAVREVRGATAVLPGGGLIDARVSCARLTGECVVVGSSSPSLPGRPSLYISSGRDGAWGPARLMPGPPGRIAIITAIACAPSGGCLAAGAAERALGGGWWPFVESVRNGTPGAPAGIPGLAALDVGGPSTITSVSCASAGDCVAGGTFSDANGRAQAFVAEERDGRWGAAEPVPGLAALNTAGGGQFPGSGARLTQLACGRAGDCAAGGTYRDVKGSHAWVAAEVNGRWSEAMPVPGAPPRHAYGAAKEASPSSCSPVSCALGDSAVNAVSCTGQGTCVAGGYFTIGRLGHRISTAFTVTEHGGIWGRAAQLPGLAALNKGRDAGVAALSCAPSGGCGVIGDYAATRSGDTYSMFVVAGSIGR